MCKGRTRRYPPTLIITAIITALLDCPHDGRQDAGVADGNLPHRGARQHRAGKGMARPENDARLTLFWEKTIVHHLGFADHVGDVTEVEPEPSIGR